MGMRTTSALGGLQESYRYEDIRDKLLGRPGAICNSLQYFGLKLSINIYSGLQEMASIEGPEVSPQGFTVLSGGIESIVDIIFIHGLCGHPRSTWALEKKESKKSPPFGNLFKRSPLVEEGSDSESPIVTDIFWPAEFLPEDVPSARILTYGYESSIATFFQGGVCENSFYQHSRDMLFKLGRQRETCGTRPIIFVAHSLGGIIVKDVLQLSRNDDRNAEFRSVFAATRAVVFLGTPHKGSGHASWANHARKIAGAALLRGTNNRILNSLRVDSSELERLRDEFAKILKSLEPKISIYSFQEGVGVTGVKGFSGKVVDDGSSALHDGDEVRVTIKANHMDMCKFSSKKDDGYESVQWAICQAVKMISD